MTGAGIELLALTSVNFGSAVAGLLIPVVGAVGVVAARQLVTLITVLPVARPPRTALRRRTLVPAIGLGVSLAVMNLAFYEAVGILGLGIAAVLEFLGPFALALAGSRRVLDGVCALGALGGVAALTGAAGRLDPWGIVLALVAAVAWIGYIVLTRRVVTTLPGLQGLAIASVVATVLVVPIALLTVDVAAIDLRTWGMLLALGLLSSAIPYSLDALVLRRITPRIYAILTSFGPAIASVFGWLVLGEAFTVVQQAGIALVCASAVLAVATQRDPVPAPPPEAAGGTETAGSEETAGASESER